MQIQKISFNNYINRNYNTPKNKNTAQHYQSNEIKAEERASYVNAYKPISFSSLKLKASDKDNDFCDTSFYRDLYTLVKAKDILVDTFPEGADIMDFACSNGEEAISIHSLVNDKNNGKYKLYCYDKSRKIIDLANKGVHTVYKPGSGDGFLLRKSQDNEIYDDVMRCFNEIMEETKRPNYDINDPNFIRFIMGHPDFKIKHYKVRDEYKDNFQFDVGNIFNIDKLGPEKVGAVFFRNAIYIPTKNYGVDEFDSLVREKSVDKRKVINRIVDKVYDKLLPGGIFVLGENEKDHIFIADNYATKEEKLYIEEYGCYVYKNMLLDEALLKDGRFKPVTYSRCFSALGEMEVPTVWQKVK